MTLDDWRPCDCRSGPGWREFGIGPGYSAEFVVPQILNTPREVALLMTWHLFLRSGCQCLVPALVNLPPLIFMRQLFRGLAKDQPNSYHHDERVADTLWITT